MQPGRRSGNGAGKAGEDGLIPLGVHEIQFHVVVAAVDIRRQRSAAGPAEQVQRFNRRFGLHGPDALTPVGDQQDRLPLGPVDLQELSLPDPAAAAEHHLPTPMARFPQEKSLDPRAGLAAHDQPRGDDPRVVQHHQVPRPQQRGQFVETVMVDGAGCPIQPHQPALVAAADRPLGDGLHRQAIVEKRGLHDQHNYNSQTSHEKHRFGP